MNEPVSHLPRKENRKMIFWFLFALLIALLPWFLLAREQRPKSNVVTNSKAKEPTKACASVCPISL